MPLSVGIFSRDPDVRLEAARAFDAAPASWIVRLYDELPQDVDVVVYGSDTARGDGLVFDPADSGNVIGAIAEATERRVARTIVVTSPAGGAGVTSVATHLARALPSSCLVDLDPFEGARHRLGIETPMPPADGRSAARSTLPVAGGFRILTEPAGAPAETIEALAGEFHHLVIDVPRSSLTDALLGCADLGVLVMAPTVPCVAMASEMQLGGGLDWAFLFNRCGPGGEVSDRALATRLGHKVMASLPCTPSLRDREDEGMLLRRGWTRWERSLARIAEELRVR